MSSTRREAWKPTFGSLTARHESYSARSAKSSKAFARASANGACPAPNGKLHAVANYLYCNRSRMRYHEYLANGWPIASGPVEGVVSGFHGFLRLQQRDNPPEGVCVPATVA